MYAKLFTKILDSSVWLEKMPTRIVWLTLLAAMDKDGFAQFSAIGNVAGRARVTHEEAAEALACLEAPDDESADKSNDGRRIERVEGGWMILNAAKYRELVTRDVVQQQTRERVARFRASKRGNAIVTSCNEKLTPSETETETETETQKQERVSFPKRAKVADEATTLALRSGDFIERYKALHLRLRKGAHYLGKPHYDFQEAQQLCAVFDDATLDKLAYVWLNTNHEFAESGTRTLAKFRSMASWCQEQLIAWEQSHGELAVGQ